MRNCSESVCLKEDGLQLSTVSPRMLLGEENGVCRDAVVRHTPVALQHPNYDVWEAVLRLDEGCRVHREGARGLNLLVHNVIQLK